MNNDALDAHIFGDHDQSAPTYLSDGTEAELGMRVRRLNTYPAFPDWRIRAIESGEVFIEQIFTLSGARRVAHGWIEASELEPAYVPILVRLNGRVWTGDTITSELWEWQIRARDGRIIAANVRGSLSAAADTAREALELLKDQHTKAGIA